MPNTLIREGYLDSDRISALSDFDDRVFFRLLLAADDAGRADGRVDKLRSALFPTREKVRGSDVEKSVGRLIEAGLLSQWEWDGKPVLQVMRWQRRSPAKYSKFPNARGEFLIEWVQRQTRDGEQTFAATSIPPESSKNDPIGNPFEGVGQKPTQTKTNTETKTKSKAQTNAQSLQASSNRESTRENGDSPPVPLSPAAASLRSELQRAGVEEPSLSRLVASNHTPPVCVVLLGIEAKEKKAKSLPAWIVSRLQKGYTPPPYVPPKVLAALCRAGRVRAICGHVLHPAVPATWSGAGDGEWLMLNDETGDGHRLAATDLKPEAIEMKEKEHGSAEIQRGDRRPTDRREHREAV